MWFNTLPYDPESPKIDFKDGILTLSGRCIPTDGYTTLYPIFDEIREYLEHNEGINLVFRFDAVNTTSAKNFIDLFLNLNIIQKEAKPKKKITIFWDCPVIDEDMIELGEYYKEYSDQLAKEGKFNKIIFKIKTYRYE